MKKVSILMLVTPFLSFAQLNSNYIDLGGQFKAYSYGDIHLVEDIDFTTTSYNNLDAPVAMYDRQLWNPNPVHPTTGLYQVGYINPQPTGMLILRDPVDNFIDNSGLHLRTTKIYDKVYSWHSLSSSHPYRYGIYEFEARLTEGNGLASSFFLFSDRLPYGAPYAECNGNSVTNGGTENKNWQEIDVWEMGGGEDYRDKLRSDLHYTDIGMLGTGSFCDPGNIFNPTNPICEKCNKQYLLDNTSQDFFDEYHTFTLYWDPHYIITFVDGNVYRYWITDKPNPVKYGDPQPANFIDAMYIWLESKIFDRPYDLNDPLHGLSPSYSPPSDELTIRSFRHWVFIPCFQNSPDNSQPVYNSIQQGNKINMGLFETGDIIEISDTKIEAATYVDPLQPTEPPQPITYKHGDKLIAMASKRITLMPGFHASGSSLNKNYPDYPEFFRAIIKPCGSYSNSVWPTINNMGEGSTYLQQFWENMPTKISESFNVWGGSTWITVNDTENSIVENLKVTIENGMINVSSEAVIYDLKLYTIDGRLINVDMEIKSDYSYEINRIPLSSGFYVIIINDRISNRLWLN